jgi:hypothetical protein
MQARTFLGCTIGLLLSAPAFGYPRPLYRTENIPQLMAESTLVCKGEVTDAPDVTSSENPDLPRLTATAIIRADRCFKGQAPDGGIVPVLFDNVLPAGGMSGGTPFVVLRKGDYCLFFLKPRGDEYAPVNDWFGQLTISRNLASDFSDDPDPMHRLEADLKAGLADPDRDRVLDSIRMLGNMRHLRSEAELTALLGSPDPLVRTCVQEAMLRLRDYSVLPAVAQWLIEQPPPPSSLAMPADALFAIQFRLTREVSAIRDPAALPFLLRLLRLPNRAMRLEILDAIRAIHSPQSSKTFLKLLDDPDDDIGFIAMQSLFELRRVQGPIDWVPSSFEQFHENRAYYANLCRQWWQNNAPQQ